MARRKNGKRSSMYTVGMPLLFVTLIAVCLIILTAVALITSRNEMSQSKVHSANRTAYMDAANQVEEELAEINRTGKLPKEGRSFRVSISTGGYIEVTLTEDGDRFRVRGWHVVKPSSVEHQTVSGV